jgi:signal transduction histidine kinase
LVIKSKPNALDQILSNLISNSITHGFSELGNGIITITVMNSTNGINISYSDNGKGVDDTIKDKLFDPFTTTRRGAGAVGLGLHLVYNLVTQALDGTIELDNNTNNGVIFDINFPIDSDEC